MKHILKIIQWVFVAVMASFFVWQGFIGQEPPGLQGLSDFKFRLREVSPLKGDVKLVEIDNRTLEQFSEFGRWPWQRDPQAFLIYTLLQYQPSVLVLDIIYSQAESVRIPRELEDDLRKIGRADLVERYSPEAKLIKLINHYKNKIVLAGGAESLCFKSCEQAAPPAELAAWAKPVDVRNPIIENPILNLSEYNAVASHFGFSVAQPGNDGVFRKIFLNYNYAGLSYPALALSAVKAAQPAFAMPAQHHLQINFRSDIREKHSVSAADVLMAEKESDAGRALKQKIRSQLEGKIVVLGVTASAAGDYHASPVGLLSGPEILATTIDNLLAGDFFLAPAMPLLLLLLVLTLLFFIAVQKFKSRLSSLKIVGIYVLVALGLVAVDAYSFKNYIDLPSVWLYLLLLGSLFLVIFDKYTEAEAQKAFIKSAFSKYISPDFVNEIVSNPEKLKVGGQKKELTIMFSDIRSFTTFSEKMDAKTLGEFLHEYLDEMTDIVFASRGTLDKYIGDAVMAFWGDPLKATDHASNACESAVKMIRWVKRKQPYFAEKYGIDLQVGIGIHTGPVSGGNMGSSKSLGYTVIGDAVNFTSRLEGATKEYGVSILSTEETLRQIRDSGRSAPAYRELDSLTVKGKQQPVRIVQFFDEDPPAGLVENFAKARKLYLAQKWTEAISIFKECGEDKTSHIFIERCLYFKSSPPPADWDGSWKLQSK